MGVKTPGRLLNSTDRKEDKEKRKSAIWQEVNDWVQVASGR